MTARAVVMFAFVHAACGGHKMSPVGAAPSSYAESPRARPVDANEGGRRAESTSESASPVSRPGLATTWGETRFSHVVDTSFERASRDPYSTLTLRYDDEAGFRAAARRATPVRSAYQGRLVEVRVEDQNERELPMFETTSGPFVVGEHGGRYAIVVQNLEPRRVEVVVSVDGLDVLSGREANTDARGYVIDGGRVLRIEGFRTSHSNVAAFRFGSVRDSYAAQSGDARNVGVIGVAVFKEEGDRDEEDERRRFAKPFPGRDARW